MVFYWYYVGMGEQALGSRLALSYHRTRETFRKVRNG